MDLILAHWDFQSIEEGLGFLPEEAPLKGNLRQKKQLGRPKKNQRTDLTHRASETGPGGRAEREDRPCQTGLVGLASGLGLWHQARKKIRRISQISYCHARILRLGSYI